MPYRDRGKANAAARARYAANPGKHRASNRVRYIRNRIKNIATSKAWQKANPEKVRANTERNSNKKRLRKYGLTGVQYLELIMAQGDRCAGCLSEKNYNEKWHIDHCHETNKVRGLLCGNCNKAIGLLKDSTDTLLRLARYLEVSSNSNSK